ncbi:hypothetical protein EXIGLDRAFT_846069 [Exidia glandulosa HHB12029]|uniref:Uncharacterized protein n=1 Tax=Exidia glandulosa HHB12029 TaxID=1314781 RepID=A0A165B664_EXIGL|nr:hypothetical protein EXIGLDRAFT_846069 [Exidia glandulosa HHB12029]
MNDKLVLDVLCRGPETYRTRFIRLHARFCDDATRRVEVARAIRRHAVSSDTRGCSTLGGANVTLKSTSRPESSAEWTTYCAWRPYTDSRARNSEGSATPKRSAALAIGSARNRGMCDATDAQSVAKTRPCRSSNDTASRRGALIMDD